jgi:hypothetical protein
VTYKGVIDDNTDLAYAVSSSQLKETIVLNSEPATAPTYRFKINTSKLTPSTDDDGTIVFKDKNDTTVFSIPQGVMWDSNTTTDYSINGQVAITLSADKKYIDIVPDWSWMSRESTLWPVSIDPTVDFGLGADDRLTAHDAWTASDNPNTTFNGSAQIRNGLYENLFGHNVTNTDYTTLFFVNTDAAKSTYVNNATLHMYPWERADNPHVSIPTPRIGTNAPSRSTAVPTTTETATP